MAERDRDHPDDVRVVETGQLGRGIAAMRVAGPPAEVTERMMAKLGIGPGGSGPEGSSGPSGGGGSAAGADVSVTATGASGAAKLMFVGLATMALGLGTFVVWKPTTGVSSAVSSSAPIPSTHSAEPPTAPSASVSESPVLAASSAATAEPTSVVSRQAPPPPAEAQLLASAKRMLSTDPAGAIRLLQQHARLYPDGMLSQEREVLLIEAKAKMGQADEARNRAREFLDSHPDSAYGNKIQESAFGDAGDHKPGR